MPHNKENIDFHFRSPRKPNNEAIDAAGAQRKWNGSLGRWFLLILKTILSIKLSSFTAVQTKDGNMWNDFKK